VKLCEMQITIFECEKYASKFFLEKDKYVCVFNKLINSINYYRVMINWHYSLISWHHSSNTLTLVSQIKKESCKKLYFTCSLYSQHVNHMTSKKVAKFIKLIKRFRTLQEWLKTSDIWRDYQIWNESFLKLFQKFKVLMFFESEH
jgi:hypothetical protein